MKNITKHIANFFKGMLLGFICVATPGVSGGTIAAIIGLFSEIIEKGNDLFHNFFKKDWWKTVLFFVIVALGAIAGALLGSVIVTFTYDRFPLATTLCIIGLIIGSFPYLYKSIEGDKKHWSNILTFVIVIALALVYTFCLKGSNDANLEDMNIYKYLLLILLGTITTATMIIPGISGSIFLMAFGYYFPINNILSNIFTLPFSYSLPILACFAIGIIIGGVLIIKLIKLLLDKFKTKTTIAIFAFVVASPIIMIKICILSNETFVFNVIELLVGIALMIFGFFLSYFISKKAK